MEESDHVIFPFAAIVGQEEMKTALVLNVIDPSIGGLLIMGEKGTAKATAIRALAELLPEMEAVDGCPCHCEPGGPLCSPAGPAPSRAPVKAPHAKMRVVELPLGVTEDRLVGSLDIEHALRKGEKRFEPGLLAAATVTFFMSTRSTCSKITSSICSSTPPPWASTRSSARAFRSPIPPASSWSAA